jgi:DNA-binding NtrC family response regulator
LTAKSSQSRNGLSNGDIRANAAPGTRSASALAPAASMPFILVVDDEEDLAESLAEFFRQSMPGIRVQHATTGPDAMAVMAREDVDVIVTDLRMPGMDGLAVLQQADQLAPDAERIVISGFSSDLTAAALKEHRVSRLFAKPFDVDEFVTAINTLIERRRQRRPLRPSV